MRDKGYGRRDEAEGLRLERGRTRYKKIDEE